MFVTEAELAKLAQLNTHLRSLSDEEFTEFFRHIQTDELGHPDDEYMQLGFEGELPVELFCEALSCERDRREAHAINGKDQVTKQT